MTTKKYKLFTSKHSYFSNWSIQDLWNQYQFCQEKPSSFNNQILELVIEEIKNRTMENLTVSTKDIRHNMTDVQLLKTIKDLKTMLKFAKLEYQIRNY